MTIRTQANPPRMLSFSDLSTMNPSSHLASQPTTTSAHDSPDNGTTGVRPVFKAYEHQLSGQRNYTSGVIATTIQKLYPKHHLTISSAGSMFVGLVASTTDLIGFAAAGHASAVLAGDEAGRILERSFLPPARRYDEDGGEFADTVIFAAFDYVYQGKKFLLYVADCRDGENYRMKNNYLLTPPEEEEDVAGEGKGKEKEGRRDEEEDEVELYTGRKTARVGLGAAADALIEAATKWGLALHEEILLFDQGNWTKDKELWKSIQKASWDDVILDEGKKKTLIDDVDSFFGGAKHYEEFSVPWKRGLIFYGPPGNGKTISIKALTHSLSLRKSPTVEMLYVKSFTSYGGPQYAIRLIFSKARAMAPCLLIFEDIDSLVSDQVRSYFLNEVDGLESNHGILMIGSTNHLERLDPGISKRPSRFDRKYLFDMPNWDERRQYSDYWRNKLAGNKKIDFPEALNGMIADITDGFSFAYLKEAFVASLLAIVAETDDKGEDGDEDVATRRGGGGDGDGDDDGKDKAAKTLLWKVIQKQVQLLRDELGNAMKEAESKTLVTGSMEMPMRQGRMAGAGRVVVGSCV